MRADNWHTDAVGLRSHRPRGCECVERPLNYATSTRGCRRAIPSTRRSVRVANDRAILRHASRRSARPWRARVVSSADPSGDRISEAVNRRRHVGSRRARAIATRASPPEFPRQRGLPMRDAEARSNSLRALRVMLALARAWTGAARRCRAPINARRGVKLKHHPDRSPSTRISPDSPARPAIAAGSWSPEPEGPAIATGSRVRSRS